MKVRRLKVLDRSFFGIFTIIYALFLVWALWQIPQEWTPMWRAAAGHGTTGVFTPRKAHYYKGRTDWWSGDFVSTDHSVTKRNVQLDNPPARVKLGSPLPAVDTGADDVVYGKGQFPSSLVTTAIAVVLGPAVLALLVLVLRDPVDEPNLSVESVGNDARSKRRRSNSTRKRKQRQTASGPTGGRRRRAVSVRKWRKR